MLKVKPHISNAVKADNYIFVSGQLPFSESGKILSKEVEDQTRQCLENIAHILSGFNADLSDVVKTTVWLTDPNHFPLFNQTYAEYFPSPPARATVGSTLMIPDALVEIEAIAYLPS